MILAILRHHRVWSLLLAVIVLLGVGTGLFSSLEDWSVIDAFYFTVSVMTTVGFGDLVVTHDLSKLLASLFMLLTVPLLLISIELTVAVLLKDFHRKMKR